MTNSNSWLILTENQEKAVAFRKAVPSSTCISTKGLPWEIQVEIGYDLHYKKMIKDNFKEILKKIKDVSIDFDKILLAFDPTTAGEALAIEIEDFLGIKKCVRWGANALLSNDIQKAIARFETLQLAELPKSNRGIASSYWCQTAMDITWTSRITKWLKEKTSRTEKITRIMGEMLRTITAEQQKQEMFRPYEYWEMATTLKKQGSTSKKMTATTIVPTFAQIGAGAPTKTKEIWKKRMEEAKNATLLGTGVPQPEPGKAWRYSTQDAAALQKNHILKFPFFILNSTIENETEGEVSPPLTNSSILRIGLKTKKGTHEEIQKALLALYYEGHITHPKTNNPNFWKRSIESLIKFGESKKIPMNKEHRDFSDSTEEGDPRPKTTEAIRPTLWSRLPEELETLLPPTTNKQLKSWLYNIIYQRAFTSQIEQKGVVQKKHYFVGPLYLTKKGAEERAGKPFLIKKENNLQAHMNIVLCAEENIELSNSKQTQIYHEGEVLECISTQINKKEIEAPKKLTEEELFDLMINEGLGKRETLKRSIDQLKLQECVVEENDEIKLTKKGKSLTSLLNNNFGQFLDQNYHHTITENMRMIEAGRLEEEEFLQEWWACLRTFLEENKQDEEPINPPHPKKIWRE